MLSTAETCGSRLNDTIPSTVRFQKSPQINAPPWTDFDGHPGRDSVMLLAAAPRSVQKRAVPSGDLKPELDDSQMASDDAGAALIKAPTNQYAAFLPQTLSKRADGTARRVAAVRANPQLEGGLDWSGRPGSNRRHRAWEARVLPLNYSRSGW